ncbi:hypothetical protein [Arthrobacter sp. S2(2024)]|uniref:hypothetical protein n=1 Tax=Arthrobacter sp. S2(2024) TaxID=3111911 RepID=UPI002FC5BF50
MDMECPAWAAALDYADEHEGIYDKRTLATAAFRALLAIVEASQLRDEDLLVPHAARPL